MEMTYIATFGKHSTMSAMGIRLVEQTLAAQDFFSAKPDERKTWSEVFVMLGISAQRKAVVSLFQNHNKRLSASAINAFIGYANSDDVVPVNGHAIIPAIKKTNGHTESEVINHAKCIESDQEISDESLVAIITSADVAKDEQEAAFSLLYKKYQMTIFAIVLRRLRNRAWADEITQDVFTHALGKMNQIRDGARLKGWLKQMAIRMAINAAVRKKNDEFGNGMGQDAFNEGREMDIFSKERGLLVHRVLALMPQQSREILDVFYLKQMSIVEIAASFDAPVGTIKRRLHTARGRMQVIIQEHWPEYAESPLQDL